jgi:hypothetical protein
MSLNQNFKKSKYFKWGRGIIVLFWLWVMFLTFMFINKVFIIKNLIFSREEQGIYFDFSKEYVYADFIPPAIDNLGLKYEVLASKSGTRYYFPNCSGVKRIKTENLVYFKTVEEAEKKGLTLAKNCSK